MTLEDEMRREIRKLSEEVKLIDEELKSLQDRIIQLLLVRQKKHRDMVILKSNFEPTEIRHGEVQTSLARMLREAAK